MIKKAVGSRTYNEVDFFTTCVLSGLDNANPVHTVNDGQGIVVRSDLVTYCFEFFTFKFGVAKNKHKDLELVWDRDEWKYYNNKVYRENVFEDIDAVKSTLDMFCKNFKRANGTKIHY